MNDGIGLAERLLGLDGFRVLEVTEGPEELVITIETTADFVGCSACGVRAEAHDRMPIAVRDLACFGRPGRLVWVKRRCREPRCEARTWTEQSTHVDAQAWTRPSPAASTTRCPRSSASVTTWPGGGPRSSPTTTPVPPTAQPRG
jgi:hypothetical protein